MYIAQFLDVLCIKKPPNARQTLAWEVYGK
jgi:hypothetical protein